MQRKLGHPTISASTIGKQLLAHDIRRSNIDRHAWHKEEPFDMPQVFRRRQLSRQMDLRVGILHG